MKILLNFKAYFLKSFEELIRSTDLKITESRVFILEAFSLILFNTLRALRRNITSFVFFAQSALRRNITSIVKTYQLTAKSLDLT